MRVNQASVESGIGKKANTIICRGIMISMATVAAAAEV
jgi:hypothetical protein